MFENNSNDYTSNLNEIVDATWSTDDNKQIESHNKDFMAVETKVKKEWLS